MRPLLDRTLIITGTLVVGALLGGLTQHVVDDGVVGISAAERPESMRVTENASGEIVTVQWSSRPPRSVLPAPTVDEPAPEAPGPERPGPERPAPSDPEPSDPGAPPSLPAPPTTDDRPDPETTAAPPPTPESTIVRQGPPPTADDPEPRRTTTRPPVTAAPTAAPTTRPPTTRPPTTRPPTTAAPAPAPQPPSGPVPRGVGGQWDLVFADEFSGSSLDTSVWEPGWWGRTGYTEPVNVDELGCYHSSQVRVTGGSLELTARANSNTSCRLRNGQVAGYVSGLVNSRTSFSYTEGYVEVRMFLPGSGGRLHNWPAAWTNGAQWPNHGEIDIMEGLSTNWPCFSYHWGSSADHRSQTTCVEGGDATGWHTFGVDRRPGQLDFYYDGVLVGSYTSGITTNPHYLILNYGLTGTHGVNVPSTVKVDYVRVWSRS